MDVVSLNAETFESFLGKFPVTAILFYTPRDKQLTGIRATFDSVAKTFNHNVGFGVVDLTAAENAVLMEEGVETRTPTIHYYWFGELAREIVGHDAIFRYCNRDSILLYAETKTGWRMIW